MSKRQLLAILASGLVVTLACALYFDWYGTIRYCESEDIQLDGYSLAAVTCGVKKPTVIFEAGLGVSKDSYLELQKQLFPDAQIIAYDHAGIGDSSMSGNPRTLPFYVQELQAMLAQKELEPPYILIGHSLGGHIVRYFTYLYPDQVAGLVFLDHPHEDWFRHIRENWTAEEQNEYFKWWNPKVRGQDDIFNVERLEYDNNNDLIRGKVIPSHIPVLMFTGDNAPHFRKDEVRKIEDRYEWARMQLSLISHLKHGKQIVDWETGHWPHKDKPEEVAREIRLFMEKVSQTL